MSETADTQAPRRRDVTVTFPAIQEMAEHYNLPAEAFAITFRTIAMPTPHTDAEFVSCCLVAQEHELNPLTKEIYFMRDKHGRMQAIVGVDGWIKKCNSHRQFDGIEFDDHKDSNGVIGSITCRIYRKDRSRPTMITEYLAECRQPQRAGKDGPWQTHPSRMLRNRTICQCARLAFGFAGLMERDEFETWMAHDAPVDGGKLVETPEPPTPPEPPKPEPSKPKDAPAPEPAPKAPQPEVVAEIIDALKVSSGDAEIYQETWDSYSDVIEALNDADRDVVERACEAHQPKPKQTQPPTPNDPTPPAPPEPTQEKAPDPPAPTAVEIEARADRIIEGIGKAANKTRLAEISKNVDPKWPKATINRIRVAYMEANGRITAGIAKADAEAKAASRKQE